MICVECDHPLTGSYEKKLIMYYLLTDKWLGCEKCGVGKD